MLNVAKDTSMAECLEYMYLSSGINESLHTYIIRFQHHVESIVFPL